MSKWMLIDGNSITYRAFFAMPPLTNSSGMHTNAIYGFTTMLLKLIEEHKPSHILVAFDAGKVNFRHEQFEDYKGGRQKTPPELSQQFPILKELITAFGIQQYELSGYEADDIIGTLTKKADEQGVEVMVISGDKDMLQLASENVTIALTRKGVSEIELYSPETISEKYGLTPLQIIDLKGLMGDTSDNIPGVPGVGEKTALKLLHQFPSVEEVLANLDAQKGKLKENLTNNQESAIMSKKLATIFREVPLEHNEDQMQFNGYDHNQLAEQLQKLEFKSLIERLQLSAESGSSAEEARSALESLRIHVIANDNDASVVNELMQAIEQSAEHGLFIEAIGDNPHQASFEGLSISFQDDVYVIAKDQLTEPLLQPFCEWLSNEDKPKYGYDLHKSELVLSWIGVKLGGAKFDVQLAAYLLDPTDGNQLLYTIAERHNVYGLASDDEVYGKGAKLKLPEDEKLFQHLALKARTVEKLVPLLNEELEQMSMLSLYYDLEGPLSRILAKMELQGIKVASSELENQGVELEAALKLITASIYELAGMEFKISSPKQLGEVLFEKLSLPAKKKTKTGYSTDAEVLEELAPYHPIIAHILNFRQLSKLQSTYVEGLLKEVNPTTGKIHTYYRQTIAATGRLSSQFPNLQNIPIRLEEGRKIRKAFVPSEAGWTILAADYSQIELRVLAHISGDEKLKEAFIHNMDIHTKTAMDVFGVTAEEVDSNMRRSAKAVNFGIVYGISDFGLSQNLGITRKEAAQFIEQYFNIFSGVRKYMEDIVAEAKSNGYILTLLDRRRYVPDIHSSNFNLRSFAERIAMNTPIQGTAADIIKLAMVRMEQTLKERQLESRMLLQVHDELVFEVPPHELELMKQLVPQVMSEALQLDVPLRADVSFGNSWYEAK
ncbi:MAG: DNA polymerase I [Candidatus Pristimantibacillus lignocellulolyticus]|uniref:DNA polymerase I n=1 Tax=Candidatus Pristimantibacillus lignocellulolyticus TaxID=2994561 RepID=A0A9J6ZEJ8_9BACL|nr:MAG: DNA polymerase I [Candidatus Pristimantibacillus lignocellulolyticus]